MTFDEVLEQVMALLKRQGRVSFRALKVRFDVDDEYLEALKEEILYIHESDVEADERGFTWTGDTEGIQVTTTVPSGQAKLQPIIEPGQLTQSALQPVEPPTPDAERRQLTVMFCDLVDSTKLSGQLDPEDLRDVIRAYQSTSSEIIERYDGYIAQHLGDGLMVYFGWPQAHEDDAQRAVHVGLGILEAMRGLNDRLEQEKGIRLAVRIGIHTGLVVVGEIGRGASQEHLALGETPNVASRIQGVAEPDTVAISAATYQLVQGYFVCDDLGHHMLKGVGETRQVHRVVRESDVQSRFDVAAIRGLTPLVGRESETTLLFERWEQVKAGQGQVVLLSGEAGIGKSRLLQVLRDHVGNEPHTRLECRSSPYYRNTALYPITDFLQRNLNWNSDDTPQAKLDKLEQTLPMYRFELNEAIPLFANLLSLTIPEDRYPPLNMSPQRQRQKTLESIVSMLLQQARQRPVLFVLEDLHWTDPSTLDLLDLLIDQVPTTSLFTLLTCRPAFQPSWSHRSYLTEITVNHLSQSQITRMAEQVAGEKNFPQAVLQQIVEKTDGVPLFVEEMTKAVLESETLKEVNGQYELSASLSTLSIPTTLQDSLMARLDRLVTAKAVAQYAAVIGRQFSYELLQAISQLDEATLHRELERLVEAELIYQQGLPPRATYLFKHALVQDAAYQALLKSTRQQYHRRIAEMLEAQFPETVESQPELVAHHYAEAGLSEPAVRYWQKAGQVAVRRSANQEAITHLTRALEWLPTLPENSERIQRELDILVALRAALSATKGYAAPELEPVLARARELCQQVEDSPQHFRVLRGLAGFYVIRGELQVCLELNDQCLTLAQRLQDAVSLQQAHQARGLTLSNMGNLRRAQDDLEQAIARYAPQQHHAHVVSYGQDSGVTCRTYAASVLWLLGYPDQALAQSREAIVLAKELSHPLTLANTLVLAANFHLFRREIEDVQKHAAAGIKLATEQGFGLWLASGTFFQGWALAMQGQSKSGIAKLHQGLEGYRVAGSQLQVPFFLAVLADVYANLGQSGNGLRVLDEALAVVDKTGIRGQEAELYRLKGVLLLQQTVLDALQAEACFHQALDIARRQQAKSLELRAATSLARLWQSQGKRQEAYDLLQPVYGWFAEGFDTADLQDARTLLDELG